MKGIIMNKPNWKDAPEWANYLAMDSDGSWYWFELEPWYDEPNGIWYCANKHYSISNRSEEAARPISSISLEKRP